MWSRQNGTVHRGQVSKKDKDFRRARWTFFAAAGISMISYLLASGLVRFEIQSEDVEEDREGEEGDHSQNNE